MTVLEWLQELEKEERIVKVGCAQDAKRRAYEKQFAYLDSMPQTATALKKTLAPRRVGGQQ